MQKCHVDFTMPQEKCRLSFKFLQKLRRGDMRPQTRPNRRKLHPYILKSENQFLTISGFIPLAILLRTKSTTSSLDKTSQIPKKNGNTEWTNCTKQQNTIKSVQKKVSKFGPLTSAIHVIYWKIKVNQSFNLFQKRNM